MMGWKQKRKDWRLAFRANLVPGLRAKISLFQEISDKSNEKWHAGWNFWVSIGIIHHTNNEVCVMLSTGEKWSTWQRVGDMQYGTYKMRDSYQTAISGMQLIQKCCFCDKRRRPMRHGTKAWNNQWREGNASVQDMDWMRRGWVSLQLQDLLLHQNHTSTNESVTGLISKKGIRR
jgi:hypothetical protein